MPKQTTKKDKKKTTKKPAKKQVKKAAKKQTKKRKATPKKPKDIVVVSPVNPSAQIVVASELADDAMIEAELTGEVLPFFIYQFCENRPRCKPEVVAVGQCQHRKTTGMSVKGVNEIVRRLNRDRKTGYNIRIHPDHIKIERDVEENGQKGVAVTVYAENLVDGNSAWGTKFEPYKKSGKNGMYENTFAVEKALSKAERNAKRKLIPEVAATKMIEKLMTANPEAVKYLDAPKNTEKIVSPPAPQPTSQSDLEELIIRGINEAKDADVVSQFDKRVHESDKFTDAFKKKVRKLAAERIDSLSK